MQKARAIYMKTNKKMGLAGIILATGINSGVANATPIDVRIHPNVNYTGINITNNTGDTLNEFKFDLSNYISNNDDYLIYMPFGWNETGDTTDSVHTFETGLFGTEVTIGNNVGAVIEYDVDNPSSVFYGMDMRSLPLLNFKNAITGYHNGGYPYFADLALPDYKSQNLSAVPLPGTALLLGSGLLGFGAFARRNIKSINIKRVRLD